MSHKVTITVEVRNEAGIDAACKRLGLDAPVRGEHRLYSEIVRGTGVQLEDWEYPVVFNTATAEAHYDNMEGSWGDSKRLDEFLQAYGVESVKLEAFNSGMSVMEQQGINGSVVLELTEYM